MRQGFDRSAEEGSGLETSLKLVKRLLTALEEGTLDIFSLSSGVLGPISRLSPTFFSTGVSIGLQLRIWYRSSSFLM